MITYHVTAKATPIGLWELHVDGVGVTQSERLATAESMAREYIAAQLGLPDEHGFEVTVTTTGGIAELLAQEGEVAEAAEDWDE